MAAHRTLRLVATIACALAATPAGAEGTFSRRTEENARFMLIGEHNKLGLVQFCRAQGLVGEEVVAAQRRVLAGLPALVDVGATEEADGVRGVIAFLKPQGTLAASAQAQGMTLVTACAHLALTIMR